jgi:hypothetical protein
LLQDKLQKKHNKLQSVEHKKLERTFMVKPHEKLADSLKQLKAVQDKGRQVFKSREFSRTHLERLVSNGFLSEVVKGWYVLTRPDDNGGDSTAWYASFFEFVAAYCNIRFGQEWHLSPEASLMHYAGNRLIPRQLLVYAKKGKNNSLQLKFETSIFDYQSKNLANPEDIVEENGLKLLCIEAALIQASPSLFTEKSMDMQIVLSRVKDVSEILAKLLEGGQSVVAGRVAGAFRAIGRADDADRITRTMKSSGYSIYELNPFDRPVSAHSKMSGSPCALRVKLLWEKLRPTVLATFPKAPSTPMTLDAYMTDINDRHVEDAYHSLSIEGYQISEKLIAKIAAGVWDPANSEADKNDRNALAAKGYHAAFEEVRSSVKRILENKEPGSVIRHDHHDWYMQLFGPSVRAGLLEAKNLAGYRTWPTFVRNSRYVPPAHASARDAMPVLFDLISNEPEPAVRAVLGHFVFVYLHPYGDGNGRMARFLMNAMLASGGYPWSVIKVQDRAVYMAALEQASVHGNIQPFAEFVADCVSQQMLKAKVLPAL